MGQIPFSVNFTALPFFVHPLPLIRDDGVKRWSGWLFWIFRTLHMIILNTLQQTIMWIGWAKARLSRLCPQSNSWNNNNKCMRSYMQILAWIQICFMLPRSYIHRSYFIVRRHTRIYAYLLSLLSSDAGLLYLCSTENKLNSTYVCVVYTRMYSPHWIHDCCWCLLHSYRISEREREWLYFFPLLCSQLTFNIVNLRRLPPR